MVAADLLVFDMDGVLVDVSESYRETIVQTVRHFSGQTITRELIQEYKNRGGWNNDWALSQQILKDFGSEVAYETVVDQFNQLWMGHECVEGLVARERWMGEPGLFDRLAARYQLAIFTGRTQWETKITLTRFAHGIPFYPVVCADDVTLAKPDPEGLLKIRGYNSDRRLLYFGDVIDDARSARAAEVPFVGVVEPGRSHRDEVLEQFRKEGALAIIESINQIEQVLA
jgi:HAD superfamily hydrolase (TIGR01548 family)